MPFSRKLMPAAFPVFTTISRVARTEVCAGAIRVSLATTGLPSAMRVIQVVSSARICRVKLLGGFAAAARAGACGAGGLASGWGMEAAGLAAEPAADIAGDTELAAGAGAAGAGRVGGAGFVRGGVAAVMVGGDAVPADGVKACVAGGAVGVPAEVVG